MPFSGLGLDDGFAGSSCGFAHSHAFPGGRVTVEEDEATDDRARVELGDGVTLKGEWHGDADDLVLDVPAYRTARGKRIAPHRWRLVRSAAGAWRSRPDARA